MQPFSLLSRFSQAHGIAPDTRAPEYANYWLRTPNAGLPPPDLRVWYREPGLWLPLSCAIATDSAGTIADDFAGNTTDFSRSFTNTAGDAMFVAIMDVSGVANAVSGVDYGGVSMNPLGSVTQTYQLYLYNLKSPATGSNTLTVHKTGNAQNQHIVTTYSGSDTSGTSANAIDVHGSQTLGNGIDNKITKALTTTITNDWIVAAGICVGATVSAGTGLTSRQANGTAMLMADSNAGLSTGSNSVTFNQSSFVPMAMYAAALKPAGGVGGGGVTLPELERFLRGVVRGVYH